jgi:ribosomal protein S18 acetylase RimI-like enzyme
VTDGYHLRPATVADLPGLYDVCLRTGDSGNDGTHLQDDPTLLGKFFVGPYVVLEPDLAFALAGANGVAGYLLGVLDTPRFNTRLEGEWLAPLRREVRDPGPDRGLWRQSDWVRRLIHAPDLAFPAWLQPYPSHAHIDLLPEARGRGLGSMMMRSLMTRMKAQGSPGLHLQVMPDNAGGRTFYEKLGFRVVRETPESLFMARGLAGFA